MNKWIYILFVIGFGICFSSCKDQDEVYKEFVSMGGHVYPQKADSLKILAGYNRLKVIWLKAKDPSVVRAMVYWNHYTDSLEIDLTNAPERIELDIPNLEEGTYTFDVKTYDEAGNESIISEASGTVYGVNYMLSLNERKVNSATRDKNLVGTIEWGVATADLVYTEVRYKNNLDSYSSAIVNIEDEETELPNIKPGEKFEYRSYYLPKNGIDTVRLDWTTSDAPFSYEIDRSKWTAVAKGNHAWGNTGGTPMHLLDGSLTTGWHTKTSDKPPHVLIIDTKEVQSFTSVILKDQATAAYRYMNDVNVYVSDKELTIQDQVASWGTPVITANCPKSIQFHELKLPEGTKGRYIALVFPNSLNKNGYISFMEFVAFGY